MQAKLSLVRPVEPKPLFIMTRYHVRVLKQLADHGPERAGEFGEVILDDLFKLRPRLVYIKTAADKLEDAIIDVTPEGLQALVLHTKGVS